MNLSKSSDENRYSSMTDLSLVKSVKKNQKKNLKFVGENPFRKERKS
jgi:hypothetical protein